MKLKLQLATFLLFACAFALHTEVRADAVGDWNAIAASTTAVAPGRPGPSMVLDMAAVHGAIYDAVQAIEGDYRPYCGDIPGATGTPAAAVAKAAHDVLVHRFPAQTASLGMTFDAYLVFHQIPPMDAGILVGAAAAECMNDLREDDGSFPDMFPPFFGSPQIGVWRSTAPMVIPWLDPVTPYTIRSPSQFRPKAPPALTSPGYTRAYNEVKDVGSATSTTRTAAQTAQAIFWNLSYPAVWHRALREISSENVTNVSDSSRLFALTSMVMADSLIAAWDSKSHFVYWRPSMAIEFGEFDGNPDTEGDEDWVPFVSNPAYPDYTSGANNISSSAARAFSLFFGTNQMTFVIRKDNTLSRTFTSFSSVREEVVDARIYEGIHFRFADEKARKQGEHIAQWAHGHHFKPVLEVDVIAD